MSFLFLAYFLRRCSSDVAFERDISSLLVSLICLSLPFFDVVVRSLSHPPSRSSPHLVAFWHPSADNDAGSEQYKREGGREGGRDGTDSHPDGGQTHRFVLCDTPPPFQSELNIFSWREDEDELPPVL